MATKRCCCRCLCLESWDVLGYSFNFLDQEIAGEFEPLENDGSCLRQHTQCTQAVDLEWHDTAVFNETNITVQPFAPPGQTVCGNCTFLSVWLVDGYNAQSRSGNRIKLWYAMQVTSTVEQIPCTNNSFKLRVTLHIKVKSYWNTSIFSITRRRTAEYQCVSPGTLTLTGNYGPWFDDGYDIYSVNLAPKRPCDINFNATEYCYGVAPVPEEDCFDQFVANTISGGTERAVRFNSLVPNQCEYITRDIEFIASTYDSCCTNGPCQGVGFVTTGRIATLVDEPFVFESECIPCDAIPESIDVARADCAGPIEIDLADLLDFWCEFFEDPPSLVLEIPCEISVNLVT